MTVQIDQQNESIEHVTDHEGAAEIARRLAILNIGRHAHSLQLIAEQHDTKFLSCILNLVVIETRSLLEKTSEV